MVKIFKALNGTFNCGFADAQKDRLKGKKKPPPGNLTVYKSSFSVSFSREAADFIVNDRTAQEYYHWLNGTYCPDEHYWGTIAGNSKSKIAY
jgi:hypothetical protein